MYIAEIEVTDLRSFRGTQSVNLARPDGTYPGWTVFAGRNGAGKSTLLKAVALSAVGPLAARALAGAFPAWVRKDALVARIATKLIIDANRDQFQSTGRTTRAPFWTGLEWKTVPTGSDSIERWLDKEPRQKTPDRGPWADTPIGWFIAGYGAYRHLGPVTAEIATKSADPVYARLINLFNEAATLSEAVDWLKQVHLRELEGRAGAGELRAAVIRLLQDGLLPDGSVVEKVDSDGLWVKRDGVSLPLEQVSDGYRTVTALVVDLVRRLHTAYGSLRLEEVDGHQVCRLPGVVLIDEMDAHMHVAWQQKVGFWLTTRFPAIQFLVTTHSPFICQAASPNGIIRLPGPGETAGMRHIDPVLFKAVVNGGADDAVMSELFGLEHAHSEDAEKLRKEAADLQWKLLENTATDADKARYADLQKLLPNDLGELADRKLRELYHRGQA